MIRRLFSRPRAVGLVTALVVAAAFVAAAVADTQHTSPSSVEADTTTLFWSGQGSDANFAQCGTNADPGAGGFQNGATAQNYMLWIFATDGGTVQVPPTPTVTIDGITYDNAYKPSGQDSDFGNPGAWQIVTPFVDPGTINSAFATFAVNDPGSGSWVLTISHGCSPGNVPPAAAPTISKIAQGSFDKTFTWQITKGVDHPNVLTAGGAPVTVNYTVSVSHDDGTVGNVKVTGTITVTNQMTDPVNIDGVTDQLSDGTNCTVTGGGPQAIPASGSSTFNYVCLLNGLPSGDITNTATVTWPTQSLPDYQDLQGNSAQITTDPISFTENDIHGCVNVTDTLGGSLGQVCVGGANPTMFNYPKTFTDPAGTCTTHPNTATITETGQTAGASVTDCQGADLTVSKTASGTNDRECSWQISKASNTASPQTVDQGQPATFSYTVHVAATCNTVKNVKVTGTITVSNPNDWEDITLTGLTDSLDSTGACTIDTSPGLTIPRASGGVNGSKTYNYSCNSASLSDTKNTATATWNAATYHTPTGTASGSADVNFTETLLDNCVNVSDAVDGGTAGSLGSQFCVTAAGGSHDFTYTRTFTGPTAGSCVNHSNIASFADNSTPQHNGTSNTVTVRVCSFGPRFTPGYWKNHLAPNGTSGCSGLPSGTSCGSQGPFVNSDLTEKLGNYSVNTFPKAAQIFSAMSCSFSGNAANQNQQAIGCLTGKLLAAEYNLTINHSNPCIAPVVALANQFLTNPPATTVTFGGYSGTSINYIGPSGTYTGITYTGTSNNQRAVAIALQNALDAYDNGAGCH